MELASQEIVIHSKRLADLSGGAFRRIPPMLRMAGLFCFHSSLKQASFWESQRIANFCKCKRLADLSGGAFRQIPPMLRMAGLFCSYTSLKQASFWES